MLSIGLRVHDPLTYTNIEETFLQDFLENLEEMFPLYYLHSDVNTPIYNHTIVCYPSLENFLVIMTSTLVPNEVHVISLSLRINQFYFD